MNSANLLQIILCVSTLAAALGVVFSKNAVVSALCLMATLFFTGAIYIGMGVFFVGAAQILIYAGAIAVLFVFMVMLLDMKSRPLYISKQAAQFYLSVLLSVVFAGLLMYLSGVGVKTLLVDLPSAAHDSRAASAVDISLGMLSKYMIPFQVAGLLILGAVMGAVVLAKAQKNEATKDV